MLLKDGDVIYCKSTTMSGLTKDKKYIVVDTRPAHRSSSSGFGSEADICIESDHGHNWWFGQIGSSECWTNWFISEKEWNRNIKLEELGI